MQFQCTLCNHIEVLPDRDVVQNQFHGWKVFIKETGGFAVSYYFCKKHNSEEIIQKVRELLER